MVEEIMSDSLDMSKAFVALLMALIIFVGVCGFILPSPTVWKERYDCNIEFGKVVNKAATDEYCMGDFCYSTYVLTIEDKANETKGVTVSPAHYLITSVGDTYHYPVC